MATMVVKSTSPTIIITSIFEPISASPSARVGSAGGASSRRGQSTSSATALSATNTVPEMTSAPILLCTMLIGMSPAGFIMYMTMNSTMITISMIIMSTTRTPR